MPSFRTLVAGLLLGLPIARAETLEIPVAADTSIFSFAPDNNLGALTTLPVGGINRSSNEGRLLLRFDLSPIPSSALVSGVSLVLAVSKESPGSGVLAVDVHRLSVPWGEGRGIGANQGAPAVAGEATWRSRLKGTADWKTPGGGEGSDFVTTPSGSLTLDNPGPVIASGNPGMVADVQSWVGQPLSNFGWMLRAHPPLSSGTAKRITSRDGGASGPRLRVEFTVPQGPPPPRFGSFRRLGDAFEIRFHGDAGFIYQVQYQDVLGTGPWTPLTTNVVKLFPMDILVTDPLQPLQRAYRLAITGTVD